MEENYKMRLLKAIYDNDKDKFISVTFKILNELLAKTVASINPIEHGAEPLYACVFEILYNQFYAGLKSENEKELCDLLYEVTSPGIIQVKTPNIIRKDKEEEGAGDDE